MILGAAAIITYETYRINSAYDPNNRLGNWGIPWWGEYSYFYKFYRINAVKIRSRFINMTTAPIWVGIYIPFRLGEDNLSISTTLNEIRALQEQAPNAVTIFQLGPADSSRGTKVLKKYIKFSQFYGDVWYKVRDDFISNVGNNPVTVAWGYTFAFTTSGGIPGADVDMCAVSTKITYYGHLFGRRHDVTLSITDDTRDPEGSLAPPDSTES